MSKARLVGATRGLRRGPAGCDERACPLSGSPADAARCTAFLFGQTYLSESAVDLCAVALRLAAMLAAALPAVVVDAVRCCRRRS